MDLISINFSKIRFGQPQNLQDLDWLAVRLTQLLGLDLASLDPGSQKWMLGSTNNYWLHWNETTKIARITSRYSVKPEVIAAIQTVVTELWGLKAVEVG